MLKKILATLALGLVSCGAQAKEFKSFMPENDLWKQDCLACEKTGGIDEATFNAIIDAAKIAYQPLADKNSESLTINNNWEDPTVNANCSRYDGKVEINMFGGLSRRSEINPEGFALVLCHELGHAYSGAPYIQVSSKMSAEGQADWSATNECLEKIHSILKLPEENGSYSLTKCEAKFGKDTLQYDICLTSMSGGLALGNLLAVLSDEGAPKYETPDPKIVKKTVLSYPATTQCRLDSYGAGALKLPRPKCWFYK